MQVNRLKLLALRGQLLRNIRGIKNRLQVHPLPLDLYPLLQNVAHELQRAVPGYDGLLKRLFEGRKLHGLRVHNVLVQHDLDLVAAAHDRGVLLGRQIEPNVLPVRGHRNQHLFDRKLLRRALSHLHAQLRVVQQIHIQHLLKREGFIRLHLEAYFVRNLLPVPLLHSGLAQGHHEGNLGPECFEFHPHLLGYALNCGDVPILKLPNHLI